MVSRVAFKCFFWEFLVVVFIIITMETPTGLVTIVFQAKNRHHMNTSIITPSAAKGPY